ncbi:GRAMD1B [Cervus elaphus hippelaphus]|uniref:GRAMD1B n=1 Tax=Cervus elaphus hippelaphus TaxID=46360 RepID=A0A212DIV9_CEREH|nr:GRAMD1B [Cervus elaphus hippelaphus]
MESLTESGVLWSLLLEQDSQPLQQHLEKLTEGPAGAEFCCRPGSEEIPALTVRLKDICSMTKEKTARLIPNAIQVCTDSEKPLCPKELWHFVHQCYGNELGLTSDDEDYVPPDDDFNTMGYCEEIPVEENEVNDSSSKSSIETKPDASPQLPKKSITNSTLTSTGSSEAPVSFDGLPLEEEVLEGDGSLEKELTIDNIIGEKIEIIAPVNSPSLDFNDNEDIPTELSDSSDTHDEGEVQAFYEDLSGRQYVNEVFNFSVDKLYDLLFTDSPFQRDFMEQRRFSDIIFHPWKKEENGNQSRVILYTITLTNPLAPKTATVRETQTMYKASQESECYVIDAEVLTHDVPYHDYFYTINRYTLTRVARNKSRLRCCLCGLVLLVILNMMLFYKLWMLEYTTQTLTTWQGLRLQERLPQSQTEWAQLLESQQKYHDTELQKWREIIKSSVMLLDQEPTPFSSLAWQGTSHAQVRWVLLAGEAQLRAQTGAGVHFLVLQMKDSLINLQNGIRSRDYMSESEEKRNRYH